MTRAAFSLFLLFAMAACVAGARAPNTAAETFSLAYSEMDQAYQLVDSLTTPTVPGAQPLLSLERGIAIYKQLVQANTVLDQAHSAFVAGQPYGDKLQSWQQMLIVIRAALPAGGE